jgi:hypothetical protein
LNERAKAGTVLPVAHLPLKAKRGVLSMASEVTESHHPPHFQKKTSLEVFLLINQWFQGFLP